MEPKLIPLIIFLCITIVCVLSVTLYATHVVNSIGRELARKKGLLPRKKEKSSVGEVIPLRGEMSQRDKRVAALQGSALPTNKSNKENKNGT